MYIDINVSNNHVQLMINFLVLVVQSIRPGHLVLPPGRNVVVSVMSRLGHVIEILIVMVRLLLGCAYRRLISSMDWNYCYYYLFQHVRFISKLAKMNQGI